MIAKHSLHWVLVPLILGVIQFFTPFWPLGVLFLVGALFSLLFFRDPERTVGEGIVSPADGRISNIELVEDMTRISILMGLHDVHVNRAPVKGKVISIEHIPGKHVPAFNKDSEANERVITTLETEIGEIKIIQIAGAFARRIEPYIDEGDTLTKGQRMGMIRFGSRVDLFLPHDNVKIMVETGLRVKAAATTLAQEVSDED